MTKVFHLRLTAFSSRKDSDKNEPQLAFFISTNGIYHKISSSGGFIETHSFLKHYTINSCVMTFVSAMLIQSFVLLASFDQFLRTSSQLW